MSNVKLDVIDRLETWLRGPGHRHVAIARRNIPGYGQMVPGFRVTLFDMTRPARRKSETWLRRAESTVLDTAIADVLDKARARKTATIGRKRARA